MKKVLLITCVAALMLAVAGAAIASEGQWVITLQATSLTYGALGGSCTIGTKTSGATDGKDTGDTVGGWTNPGGYVNAYEPTFGTTDKTQLFKADYKAPITAPQTKSWDLFVFTKGTFTGPLRLSWYTPSTADVPDTIGGENYWYTFEILNDPTGTYTTAKGNNKYMFTDLNGGSSRAPLGLGDGQFLQWDNAPNFADAGAEVISGAIKMRVTAAPVPEPGSMLALGSGLIGMAGFAIRRRRA